MTQLLLFFASIPIYLKYLGPDAFGLIGVYTLLQSWFNLLDLGVSPTLTRTLAQHKDNKENHSLLTSLLRSFELIVLTFSISLLFLFFLYVDELSTNWLTSEALSNNTISDIFVIFLITIFFRLFETLYKSCLIGLQKHILLNVITTGILTAKTFTSIILVIYVTTDPTTFFQVQLTYSLLMTITLLIATYQLMPARMYKANFSISALLKVKNYTLGIFGITVLSLGQTQFDKLILTKFLNLQEFGLYTLCASLASVIHVMITPISTTLGPKLAGIKQAGQQQNFEQTFMFGSQFISLLVFSVGGCIVVFSADILRMWTLDQNIASQTYQVCSLLVLGNIFNALSWMPYQAQLAYGWTSLTLKINLFIITILVPLNLLLIPIYGAYAAAFIWVVVNTLSMFLGSALMFNKILINIKTAWIISAVVRPATIGFVVPLISQYFIVNITSSSTNLLQLLVIFVISFTVILLTSKSLKFQIT